MRFFFDCIVSAAVLLAVFVGNFVCAEDINLKVGMFDSLVVIKTIAVLRVEHNLFYSVRALAYIPPRKKGAGR